jgi:hypothetical protein
MSSQSYLFRCLMLACLVIAAALPVGTFAQSGSFQRDQVSLLRSDNTTSALPRETGTPKFKSKLGGFATAVQIGGLTERWKAKGGGR